MSGAFTALKEQMKKADCSRRKVGAVVVKDGDVLGVGHNRLPEGSCLAGDCPRGKMTYEEQPKDVGYAESGCTAVHAEVAALAEVPWGQSIGATMYVTEKPCSECEFVLINSGIERVRVVNFDHPMFTGKFQPPV